MSTNKRMINSMSFLLGSARIHTYSRPPFADLNNFLCNRCQLECRTPKAVSTLAWMQQRTCMAVSSRDNRCQPVAKSCRRLFSWDSSHLCMLRNNLHTQHGVQG